MNDLSPLEAAYWLRPFEIQYKAPGRRTHVQVAVFFFFRLPSQLVIIFSETGSKLQKMLVEDMTAIDRGGPTRQFLSEAFQSLDKLKVKHANKETRLWFRDEKTGFYFPEEDDTILHNLGLWRMDKAASLCKDRAAALHKARSIVRPLARAVGRLIFYCMANIVEKDDEYQAADQRLHVNAYILPEIYLYYLLADVKPSSRDYPLGDLVKFLSEHSRLAEKDFEWKEDKDFENMKELLHCYISLHLEEQPPEDHDLHESIQQLREGLRKAAETDFIDNRQLVLLALREGMSLDDSLECKLHCRRDLLPLCPHV